MTTNKQFRTNKKLREVSLTELLNSLEYYANKDFCGDYFNFEFVHVFGSYCAVLDVFWGEGDEKDFHLEIKCSYTTINDEYGITHDIDGMEFSRIEQGDGYSNEQVCVEGLTENNLAPLLTIFFDKHADRNIGKYNNICFNLFSEGSSDNE